jgi:hypothetical protein
MAQSGPPGITHLEGSCFRWCAFAIQVCALLKILRQGSFATPFSLVSHAKQEIGNFQKTLTKKKYPSFCEYFHPIGWPAIRENPEPPRLSHPPKTESPPRLVKTPKKVIAWLLKILINGAGKI